MISNVLAPPSQAISEEDDIGSVNTISHPIDFQGESFLLLDTYANVFKNYMGSGYKTKNWKSFVNNVRDGDFIGIDFKSDGSVDHIGFVHTKSGGRLRIAQHTVNYLKWNGDWPKYDGKGTYYRVRR